jgi:hypothetical protein
MKDMENGGIKMSKEPIKAVIDRCRFRIDRALDCNIADVIRLIEETEAAQYKNKNTVSYPVWRGYGAGD